MCDVMAHASQSIEFQLPVFRVSCSAFPALLPFCVLSHTIASHRRRVMFRKGFSVRLRSRFGDSLLMVAVAAVLIPSFSASSLSAQGYTPYRFNNVVVGGGGGFITGIVFSTTQPGL